MSLAALIESGRLIDLILALVALEAAGLVALHRLTGRGPAPGAVLGMLAAGAALLVAVRLALTGAPWVWIAAALAAGLVAHLADLRGRFG